MKGITVEESTIDRLLALGTMTYETTGWGTGEISVKCRSNTKCEEESLNKPVITFAIAEEQITPDTVQDHVVRVLAEKLEKKEVHLLTVEDKKYNIAKRKFKAWKNSYKNSQKDETIQDEQ